MDSSYVIMIRALNNPTRRIILRSISDNAYSINELAEKLSAMNVDYKTRDSLYKQTELLVNAGLLDKFYDVSKKAISYKNPVTEVAIDIENWTVERVRGKRESNILTS